MNQCPKCGKFLKNMVAYMNGFGDIKIVEGRCYSHGIVNPTDWYYDQFFPDGDSKILYKG